MAPEPAGERGGAREPEFNYTPGVMYVVPHEASIPPGDGSVMNQAIDQLVNEIDEIVQAARLGVGPRGVGQSCEPGRTSFRQGGQGSGRSPAVVPAAGRHAGLESWENPPVRAACSRDLSRADGVPCDDPHLPCDDPHPQEPEGIIIPCLGGSRPGEGK